MFSDRRVSSLAAMLVSETLSEEPLEPLYGESLGIAIIAGLSASGQKLGQRSGLTPRQLKRVTDYIRQNAGEQLHLREMAALSGMSQSHFSRAFKISTGVPPYRWLLNLRVADSQKLLLDTNMPLAEIALASGFCEQSHFSRAFLAVAGMAPASWRKAHRR